MSHFKVVTSSKASDLVPVTKYKSEKTGLTVIIGEVEGPVVNGYFCLATEAHDDDGLPHTLEHLIFLGSERYPYKGILDLVANRCLADGTNAWTDTDHTCYTVKTAGSDGMLSLLPIYLNHILRPTLTEQGYITEVHHIDGNGQDAGVVYCEMQGRENLDFSRCHLSLIRALFPDSGYSAETGGIMKNLRESTNNEKVRNFHKKFYRAENLTVIITGQIEAEQVFQALEVVESDILASKESSEEWNKPWQTTPPPAKICELEVQWPADTEDNGKICLGWRGPDLSLAEGLRELSACSVLLRYMCDTPVSPLQKELVERDDALAGNISYNLIESRVAAVLIFVENVPIAKLKSASTVTKKVLAKLRSGEEAIDMERIERIGRRTLRECLAQMESEPHTAIAFQCIGDMLYSQNDKHFEDRLNSGNILKSLLMEPAEFWLQLIRKYFTEDFVSVIGSPSIELQTHMAQEEEARLAAQIQRLGPEGLADKETILNKAMEFNEREAPAGTLSNVPVPSCDNLKRHNIVAWTSDGATPCPHMDLAQIPLYTRAHSLKTNSVYITITMDTNELEQETRQWIPLLLAAMCESPVRRGDTLVPHQQLVAELEHHTVAHHTRIGLERGGDTFSVGNFGNSVTLFVQCDPSDYNKVVDLAYELLHETVLQKERLTVVAQRMVNEVSQVRRNGNNMAHNLLRDALYRQDTNVHCCSALRQQAFLRQLLERLGAGGDAADDVIAQAHASRARLTARAWLHLAADLERYKLDTQPWNKFASTTDRANTTAPTVVWDAELLGVSSGGGFAVGVGGVESAFLVQSSPGPLGYQHPDLAPLMVAINYFTQLEGPMWRLIRGAGLSYSYNIACAPHEGRLQLSLYRATNAPAAFDKAKTIIEDFLSGGSLEEELFQSAKSSLMFEVVDREKCPADVVQQSHLMYFKKTPDNYNRELVCLINSVTPSQAREAAARWLPTLFDSSQTKMSIVCHPSKVEENRDAFKALGFELEAFSSLESSHLNK